MVRNKRTLLSPRELGKAIGASESSLKRWADDGLIRFTRTAGGHRRIPLAEAIRFIRESRSPLVRPEILGLPDIEAVSGQLPAEADQSDELYRELEAGNGSRARGLVMSMYLSGASVAEICDGPLAHALRRIGELWRDDERGIFIEHRASDICIQALNQLRMVMDVDDDAPAAVGGAPDGDVSMMPSLAAATVLMSIGMHAINLGGQTPVESLIHAAREHDARLVWVSVTHLAEETILNRYVDTLAAELESTGTAIIVGGRIMNEVKLASTSTVHIGRTMNELAAFARGLMADQAAARG